MEIYSVYNIFNKKPRGQIENSEKKHYLPKILFLFSYLKKNNNIK